jgi:hypothetical protein
MAPNESTTTADLAGLAGLAGMGAATSTGTSPTFYKTPRVRTLQLRKYEADPWPFTDYAKPRPATTPSEWFSEMSPEKARILGCPFMQLKEQTPEGLTKINPLALNMDLLAAILGGDAKLGHHVVYVEGEM